VKGLQPFAVSLEDVHVSAPWRRVDWTQDVYILNFVRRLRRDCFQTLSSLPIADDV